MMDEAVVKDEEVEGYDWDAPEAKERSMQSRPQADCHSRLLIGLRCALEPLELQDTGQ